MRKYSIILIFILLHQVIAEQADLIAGHVLFRHGDRTPLASYPTDPMKEKDWPNGYGKLTTTGIQQHYRLGKFLRSRYGSILSATYTSSEIYVRSTDYDRTLMSAQSNLVGLYPLSDISNDSVPIQPVPIHTVPINDDYLLGGSDCPRIDPIAPNASEIQELERLNTYYKPFFQKLQGWTNISNITIYNTWGLADTLFVEHVHNKTPSWVTDDVIKTLSEISDGGFQRALSYNPITRIKGGPAVKEIWNNMKNASQGQSYYKVKMYSGHDTTLWAVLSFLGVNFIHTPPYASAIFIDLYKQDSKYFVKVEYLNVTDSNKPYAHVLNGCPGIECPLETFTSIYQPRFPDSFDIECVKKTLSTTTTSSRPSKKNEKLLSSVSLIVTIAGVGIIILLIFGYIYRRRRQRDAALLSDETSWEMA